MKEKSELDIFKEMVEASNGESGSEGLGSLLGKSLNFPIQGDMDFGKNPEELLKRLHELKMNRGVVESIILAAILRTPPEGREQTSHVAGLSNILFDSRENELGALALMVRIFQCLGSVIHKYFALRDELAIYRPAEDEKGGLD